MFYTDGLSNVRAVAIPGSGTEIFVYWDSTYTDKLYQVYVNGTLAASTGSFDDPNRLRVASTSAGSNYIVVLAVDPANRYTDYFTLYLHDWDSWADSTIWTKWDEYKSKGNKVKIKFPGLAKYGYGARANYYYDNTEGSVDYDTELNPSPIEIFPSHAYVSGFGLNAFGSGGFGFDGANTVGFGMGAFGYGEFGFDALMVEWLSDILGPGTYIFGVKVSDLAGNESTESETTVYLDPMPRSPSRLDVNTYSDPDLTLEWVGSEDVP